MVDTNQPTILVKKADGTTERVTLAELKSRTAKPAVVSVPTISTPMAVTKPEPTVTKPEPVIVKPVAPTVAPVEAVVKFAPAITSQVKVASYKPATMPVVNRSSFTAKDAAAPVEEPDVVHSSLSKTVQPRNNEVDQALSKLSFSVPSDYVNRLRSIVLLHIKDIRSADETKELVLRSIKDGGLGLTAAQAEELISACSSSSLPMVSPEAIPAAVKPAGLPSTTTPFNSFVAEHKPTPVAVSKPAPVAAPLADGTVSYSKPKPVSRPTMQDVVASRPAVLDPIEEIMYMTLVDFRRLAPDAAVAAKKLSQKFINLKEESILSFLRARDGWRRSPLYLDYVDVLSISLKNGVPVKNLAGKENGINAMEMSALSNMEKELGL